MTINYNETWKRKIALYYDEQYRRYGVKAQRQYPNEELCRFIFSMFGKLPFDQRKEVKLLELGCGVGGNLWMLAYEGFTVAAIDMNFNALAITCDTIKRRDCPAASLVNGDLLSAPFIAVSYTHLTLPTKRIV